MADSTAAVVEELVDDDRKRSAERARKAEQRRRIFQNAGILIPFLLVLLAGIFIIPNFISSSNITNMLVNAAILAFVGYGMTVVIAVRGIDLSVGSAQALTACITVAVVNSMGPLAGSLAGVVVGALLGLVNGILVTRFRVPGFIATLSTLSVYRGVVLLFTGGAPIASISTGFNSIATSSVLGVPRSEEHTLNSSHVAISYAVFCFKQKTNN